MNWIRRYVTRIMFALLATLPAGQIDARTMQNTDVANPAEEEIKPLVAMISCRLGEEESFGSGIVFDSGSGRLYIATANHVVRKGDQEGRNIRVLLSFLPGESLSGKLLSNYDGKLDIAVLAITDLKENGVDLELLHFDRLGTSSNLKRGDPLYSLGYPQKRPWQLNVVPDRLAERAGDVLRYESNFVKEGHSGGAVLNESRELIGMIIKDSSLYVEAINIDRVLLALRNWGYAVALQGRFHPEDLEVLSAGSTHTCYSSASGNSYCWGDNQKGQLGNGTLASSLTPMAVTGGPRFISISAGASHTCGLDAGGRAYCWGENEDGQLGSDAEGPTPRPAAVSGGLTFKFLRAGDDYTCGLTVDGVAYCWGNNTYGQLGNHSKQSSEVPVRVSGELKFNSLSLGTVHTCGIAVSGIAYCWGGQWTRRTRQRF